MGKELHGTKSSRESGKGRPKRTWREVIEKDMSVVGLRRQDVMDRVKWRQGVKSIR